jgi:hypothetical protein
MNVTQYRNLERVITTVSLLRIGDLEDGATILARVNLGGLSTHASVVGNPFSCPSIGLNTILDQSDGHWVYSLFRNKNNLIQLRGGAAEGVRNLRIRVAKLQDGLYRNCDISDLSVQAQRVYASKWFAELERMVDAYNAAGFKHTQIR